MIKILDIEEFSKLITEKNEIENDSESIWVYAYFYDKDEKIKIQPTADNRYEETEAFEISYKIEKDIEEYWDTIIELYDKYIKEINNYINDNY